MAEPQFIDGGRIVLVTIPFSRELYDQATTGTVPVGNDVVFSLTDSGHAQATHDFVVSRVPSAVRSGMPGADQ